MSKNLFGMDPSSERFTSFVIAVGALAVATSVTLYNAWKPRLERKVKIQKLLANHKKKANPLLVKELSQVAAVTVNTAGGGYQQQQQQQTAPNAAVWNNNFVYNHDTQRWLDAGQSFWFQTWNGYPMHGAFKQIASASSCWPMLNWYGERIYVCPTERRTITVTDDATKVTQEQVAVSFLGPTNERYTLVNHHDTTIVE